MNDITRLTPAQLRRAADLQEQIESLKRELDQILPVGLGAPAPAIGAPAAPAKKGKKRFSAETRAKMAAAQQARWAAKRGAVAATAVSGSAPAPVAKPWKKPVSEAKLQALAKARAARWAKVKPGKQAGSAKKKTAKAKKVDDTVPF